MRAAGTSENGDCEAVIEELLENGWTKISGGLR